MTYVTSTMHEFVVSSDRSFSTPVGPFWSLQEWRGTRAVDRLMARYPHRNLKADTPVLMCFSGLSMGDHWAPTVAQESHENLLQHFDALRPEEHLRFGQLFPRAPLGHVSGICVDDKVNIQLVPSKRPEMFLRDSQAVEAGDRAYSAAGLSYHPKKRVRRASTFTAWGAEIQGKEGLLGAKRSRLCSLSFASGLAAKSPALTKKVLEVLLGCWAFCFQFRRPLFSIIHDLYHVGSPDGRHDSPFSPSRQIRQELLLLAVLGPTSLTQLRSPVCPILYGSDASPDGAGMVKCNVGREVAQEVFRRADPRGFHTRLLSRPAAYLHEIGFPLPDHLVSNDFEEPDGVEPPEATIPEESPQVDTQFVDDTQCKSLRTQNRLILAESRKLWVKSLSPVALEELPDTVETKRPPKSKLSKTLGMKFDFLEIYTGSSRLSHAFAERGMVVAPPIDLKQGQEMMNSGLFYLILSLSLAGRIAVIWLAPPCSTFSSARHPQLRDSHDPLGYDLLNIDVVLGNLHMHLALVLWLSQQFRGRLALLQTPWGALSRHLPWWKHMLSLGGVVARLDFCEFDTPLNKGIRLLGSHPALQKLSSRCRGGHTHENIPGNKSPKAVPYPMKMCAFVSTVVKELLRVLRSSVVQPGPKDSQQNTSLLDSKGSGRFVSHLWSTQLSECLPWKVGRKYKFKRPGHINLLEVHARKSLLFSVAPNQRFVLLQDSMVALGAGAKGRSSSIALNRLLQQEMTILVAKDLYPGGVHTPTWALRADDPSRSRKVTPPRVPLPKWLHALWQGRTSQAQDFLDEASHNARALGRWLLFASSARLAVSGGFASISSWSTALRGPEEPLRLTKRESDRCNSHSACSAVRTIPTVDVLTRRFISGLATDSSPQPSHCRGHVGGVWKSNVRAGKQSPQFCRDHQRCSAGVSLSEDSNGWTLAVGDHLGDLAPTPNSTAIDDGDGGSGACLEVVANGFVDLNRILCFTEACRTILAEARAFQPRFRD